MEEALNAVNVNTVESTPQKLHKFKRKQLEDDYTPRSKHVDKRPSAHDAKTRTSEADEALEHDKENLSASDSLDPPRSGASSPRPGDKPDVFDVPETRFNGLASVGSVMSQPDFTASVLRAANSPDVLADTVGIKTHDFRDRRTEEQQESANNEERPEDDPESDSDRVVTTPGSVVRSASFPESPRDPSDDESTPVRRRLQAPPTPPLATSPSRTVSPTRTPRLRDFQLPLTTPRSFVGTGATAPTITTTTTTAMRQAQTNGVDIHAPPSSSSPKKTSSSPCKLARFTEADLISFQTPAPRRYLEGDHAQLQGQQQSHLKRFTSDNGEEMLLDMTPRVYSPKSIPIYTLHDLDTIKEEFDRAKGDLEDRVSRLHEELASSVSHTNHHKALAAQGESLHAEYSKKHVRKVTALKVDWERKTVERLAAKDARIAELEEAMEGLRRVLAQEREEKKEVIAMAEAVLALQQGD